MDDTGLRPIGAVEPLREYVRSLWQHRAFVMELAASGVRAQRQRSRLGQLWQILDPILLMGVYFLVFAVILGTDRGVENFLPFLAVGVFSYHLLRRSVTAGSTSITKNESLIRSLAFPRAVLPASTVAGKALEFIPTVAVMLIIAVATGEPVRWQWIILVPVFALFAVFVTGLVLLTARLTELVPDLENVWVYLLRIVFYLSGILYSVDDRIDDEFVLAVFDANPVYAFVQLARSAVLPWVAAEPIHWLTAGGWTMGVAALGIWWFRRGEADYGRA